MEPYSHNMMRLGVVTVWNERKVFELLRGNRQCLDQFINEWRANGTSQQRFHIPYVSLISGNSKNFY